MNTNRNLQEIQNTGAGATMVRCFYLRTSVSHGLGNIRIDAMITPSVDF